MSTAVMIAHDRTTHKFYLKGLLDVGLLHCLNQCIKFDRILDAEFGVRPGDFLQICVDDGTCIDGNMNTDGTLTYTFAGEGFDNLFAAVCEVAEGLEE